MSGQSEDIQDGTSPPVGLRRRRPPVDLRRHRAPVVLAYAAFVLVGVSAGVGGVLLPAQIRDYGVDRTAIGLIFFTGSAGFVLAGSVVGTLIHRFGIRAVLLAGAAAYLLAGLYTATRPPFVAFVLVQVVAGFGTGVLESALNAYLAALPRSTTLLNRLHAFFGVGALLGPLLATWMLEFASWTGVWLVVALLAVPLVIGFRLAYPMQLPTAPDAPKPTTSGHGGLLRAALTDRAVVLGAVLLAVYVGLEIGVGNWGFSYLVEERGHTALLAGYTISGYWLGLTLGRFLISPAASRIGVSAVGMIYGCLIGVTAAAVLVWSLPSTAAASVGFALLGFFLGPVFPTAMAVAPPLTGPGLAPTAIGVMNAGSVIGGSALPWLAGAIAQGVGVWTLVPFTVALALVQLAVWSRLAGRMRMKR